MRRILILGATGRTGSFAVDYALSKDDLEVVALARHPDKLARRERLKVVPGTPAQRDDLRRAIEGCYAVVSFLGAGTSPRFLPTAIGNAVDAMQSVGARRIVVLSMAGVGDSFALVPRVLQLLIRRTQLGRLYEAHEAQEAVLRASGLDWTAVRAVWLAGDKVKRTTVSYDGKPAPSPTISREQVATFMIDCLGHPEFYGMSPVASAPLFQR